MSLRDLRFASDYFIGVENGKVVITTRRALSRSFYERLKGELEALGLSIQSLQEMEGKEADFYP
mgnify:CR=1 FL=1